MVGFLSIKNTQLRTILDYWKTNKAKPPLETREEGSKTTQQSLLRQRGALAGTQVSSEQFM